MATTIDREQARQTWDSLLAEYDQRLEKRGDRNIHRSALMLGQSVKAFTGLPARVTPAVLRGRIERYFIASDLPPAKRFFELLNTQPDEPISGRTYLSGYPKPTKEKTMASKACAEAAAKAGKECKAGKKRASKKKAAKKAGKKKAGKKAGKKAPSETSEDAGKKKAAKKKAGKKKAAKKKAAKKKAGSKKAGKKKASSRCPNGCARVPACGKKKRAKKKPSTATPSAPTSPTPSASRPSSSGLTPLEEMWNRRALGEDVPTVG